MADKESLRAVGYARTSGEAQRDNTSIPNQRQAIESFCRREGWEFVRCYVDESKTGSKIAGRDDFQRMMKNGANGEFDVVVVFDVSRFSRDGFDILGSSRTLKQDFGIDVLDTKGHFDTRDRRNVLTNFIHAGVSEYERLAIMERTTCGQIRTAQNGKPWSSHPPIGRAYDEESGRWYVTEKGKAIATLLSRYVDGEGLTALCREFGISSRAKISGWVWRSQLAGIYKARFQRPEIDVDEEVSVPGIPEVVTLALLEKVRARLRHNRRHNRHDVVRYAFSGFIRCGDCKGSLNGQTKGEKTVYYRHKGLDGCSIKGVRADQLEPAVLDYLFGFFLDQPSFNEAVLRAMPPVGHRQDLAKQRAETEKRLAKNDREMKRTISAVVVDGVDARLYVEPQNELKAEKEALTKRLDHLENEIATLPSAEQIEASAMLTRILLMEEHRGKDWRELPYEDVKRFLFHLFGDSTRKGDTGIFVQRDKDKLVVSFRGQVDFHHGNRPSDPCLTDLVSWRFCGARQ